MGNETVKFWNAVMTNDDYRAAHKKKRRTRISKEALEAAAEPGDLSEWADMQFLLWDAQRRAGISDAEITAAMEEKLKVNMARQWPEPKDGEPRLHIKPESSEPEPCPRSGVRSSRPNGEHYCHLPSEGASHE